MGDKGLKGEKGELITRLPPTPGEKGIKGYKGDQGLTGEYGLYGAPGNPGPYGDSGEEGDKVNISILTSNFFYFCLINLLIIFWLVKFVRTLFLSWKTLFVFVYFQADGRLKN